MMGASLASFLNVGVSGSKSFVANISKKRSTCDSCKKSLVWWELIPVFSWIFLGGKCSKCKKRIPSYHLISELTLFLIFILLFDKFWYDAPSLITIYLIVGVLYAASMYDIFHKSIPNKWVLVFTSILLVVRIASSIISCTPLAYLLNYIGGSVIYFLFIFAVNLLSLSGIFPGVKKGQKGFGWGDSKFALFIGLILGWEMTLYSIWISVFAGGIFGAILLAIYRKKGLKVPFIPFMSFGVLVMILWGGQVVECIRSLLLI